uniref:Uncharacterized protein n=1 Tax=Panagrellus redivivus TaxID=6233 RepID=A0A7E4V2L2_PANRE
MASTMVVHGVLVLLLSVSTVADPLLCVADRLRGGFHVPCPAGYCYISYELGAPTVQRCATANEVIPHEVGVLMRKGNKFVFVCTTYNCNKFHWQDEVSMQYITNNEKNVCYQKEIPYQYLEPCETKKCEYKKNIKTGRVWGNVSSLSKWGNVSSLRSMTKNIINIFVAIQNICATISTSAINWNLENLRLLINRHLVQPAVKLHGPNGTAVNFLTSSPKNTETRFDLPTVATLMLVVGVYFTI